MDKSWIEMPRNTMAYEKGVKRFIDFAFERSSIEGKIVLKMLLLLLGLELLFSPISLF